MQKLLFNFTVPPEECPLIGATIKDEHPLNDQRHATLEEVLKDIKLPIIGMCEF